MKRKSYLSSILMTMAILAACSGEQPVTPVKPDPEQPPTPVKPVPEVLEPTIPEAPFVEVRDLTLEANAENGTDQLRWIDFQTGKTFKTSDKSAENACAVLDAGVFYDMTGIRFASPSGAESSVISLNADSPSAWKTRLRTRFYDLSPSEMDATKFAAIKNRTQLFAIQLDKGNIKDVLLNSSLSPFQSGCITGTPKYIGVKTFTAVEDNCYGIIEVKSVSLDKGKMNVVINYKLGTTSTASDYDKVEKVTIMNNRFYIDGKEFYANGAAATLNHAMIKEFGGNVVRVYDTNLTSAGSFLDAMQEAGLKVHFGLPIPKYGSNSKIYTDPTEKENKMKELCELVDKFKNHPAILCWCIGNELEADGYGHETSIYQFVGEISKELHRIDPNHPTTFCVQGDFSTTKMGYLNRYCSDLDFLSINIYHPTLADAGATIRKNGWTKPVFIGEYGPIGTWQKSYLQADGRLNTWGSVIQLSSDEAAKDYEQCYELIRSFDNCLGSSAFWWGIQKHGEVLGWYPFFTKDGYKLPVLEALRNCWTGEKKAYTFPQIESCRSSIKLNGKNISESKNPKVEGGAECSASVTASSRNGNPLKYKWFLYKDNTYDLSEGVTNAKIVTPAEAMPDGSINEDANADLFADRTLPEVKFYAPVTSGNYRLNVIVYDEKTGSAATCCLNFQVTD